MKFDGAAFKKWEGLCVCITDFLPCFNDATLLYDNMLADVSMPWSQGWGTMAAMVPYDGSRHGSSCFIDLREFCA